VGKRLDARIPAAAKALAVLRDQAYSTHVAKSDRFP
jgi:hypothetical protein